MKCRMPAAVLVALIVSIICVPIFAQRTANPPTVSKQDALAAIARMKTTLKNTRKAISDKYDYSPVSGTLERAFRAAGVQGKAMQYASAWGPNGVFIAYSDIGTFYNYHLAQLEESEKRINAIANASVRQADMQRLSEGMLDWEQTAKKALESMDRMTEHYARRAAMLDKKFEADRRYFATPAPQRKFWEDQAKAFDAIAVQEGRRATDIKNTSVLPIAKVRHFSAISPVAGNAPCTPPPLTPLVLTPIAPFEGGPR